MDATPPETKPNAYGKNNLVKTLLIYLVVGGILYAGVYYFVLAKKGTDYNQMKSPITANMIDKNIPTTPETQASPTAVVTEMKNKVTLTAAGFSPILLKIKAGETVVWENTGGGLATINSDAHPAHTKYPPLNLGQFSIGQTLSLLFDQPGTYGYHNHLNPSQSGTIIVE